MADEVKPSHELQWSPAYGKPFQMLYRGSQEECEKWLADFGQHYANNGAVQVVEAA